MESDATKTEISLKSLQESLVSISAYLHKFEIPSSGFGRGLTWHWVQISSHLIGIPPTVIFIPFRFIGFTLWSHLDMVNSITPRHNYSFGYGHT
jgi:hypothetical protein